MMYTASEKLAIIRLVEESELSVRRTSQEIKVSRSSFYRWYRAYEEDGLDGLENQKPGRSPALEPDSGLCQGADRRGRTGAP